ncbi:MAG TPA: non-homologous end-joining DNA ligase [Steroidobacteraceae bacterium]|nr:non-homologous end-joining DNA ligase [Steroidobacteraceae bacterium]
MPPPMRAADRIPFRVHPMLATLVAQPFDRRGWVFEEKYDGDRMLAYKEGASVRLLSRNGKDRSDRFRGVVEAIASLTCRTLLLDGEVVAFDSKRISRFQLLQQGGAEPIYAVFDCLFLDGADLRAEPLRARRAALERAIGSNPILLLSRRLAADGYDAFRIAQRRGYEGLVAKDESSAYVERRSRSWLKVKVHQEDEFVICGYTQPAGERQYFGALLLGAYEDRKLRYVGKVGTGFDRQTLAGLHKRFQPLLRVKPALIDPPSDKGAVFLAPKLIAQIAFQEWTEDRKLRQPVFLGLRDDKSPKEVLMPS